MDAALVTGAGRGLGRATARRLAEDGYGVVVNDVDEATAATVAAEIRDEGGEAVAAPADVTADGAAERLVDRAVSAFDRLGVLVNNAAIETESPALELPDEDWERVRSVALDAVFRLTRAAGRQFRDQGDGGDVVTVTSIHDTVPRTDEVHYDASKAGAWMLTKDFALELAEHDVAVNCVAPGAMATPMNADLQDDPEAMAEHREQIPAGRLGEPEEVADAVAWLVDASYVTGTRVEVDGGASLVW